MSSKYDVVKQNNNNYDIYQIKLENGKRCLYWNKKEAKVFKEIILVFNNDNIVNIESDQMFLSFHGNNSNEDINNLMIGFGTEVYKNGVDITKVNFKFVVDNKDEEEIVNNFMKKFRIKGNVVHSEKYSMLTENLEDAINNIATKSADEQIVKEDNGEINKYTIHEDKIYSDNDTLSIVEKKRALLSDWRHDPVKAKEIYNLSREELDKRLTDAVTNNLKVNYMESSVLDSKIDNEFSRVSNDKAKEEDNLVNNELGIIRNNPYSNNKYSTVERSGENINVVVPNVTTSNINNNNINSSNVSSYNVDTNTTGVDSSFWDDDDLGTITKKDIQTRDDDLPIYYVSESDEIYNQYGKFVGRNGVGGYQVDENNNLVSLVNGSVVGQIGDINDMGKSINKEKSKVRIYKPNRRNNYNSNSKNKGSVSLPVIIFIISLFLLIVSGVILFLMK